MLTSLRIQNLALIDELEISLAGGLTVLTGETGAGKSIIVGALNLVLGDRATGDVIRQGKSEAQVEALFHLEAGSPTQAALAEMGMDDEDAMLVARRVLTRRGRNRVYLNGRLATLSDLRRVVGPLVDISSQHAHTSLLKVGQHIAILDRFGDLASARSEYVEVWREWRAAERELRQLTTTVQGRGDRADFLRFQLSEIEELDPRPGEDTELVAELQILQNAASLRGAAETVEHELYGGGHAVCDTLTTVERAVRAVCDADPELGQLAERIESARIDLEDVALEARQYRLRVDVDPRRLGEVEERLDALRRLMRKHGPGLEDVLARGDRMRKELDALDRYDDALAALQSRVSDARLAAERRARALREARRRTAREVTRAVEEPLADLGMPGARFVVSIEPSAELQAHGADDVEFQLSSNPGEPPLPLARIASGGELSRIMLALKHVLAAADTVDCYVFDEVDTGVSGAVAERIGVKLREAAATRQAICITHLPQVAVHATQQLRVHKTLVDGRTVSRVDTLDPAERREEIARLLAGVEVTAQARAHAAEMLSAAGASDG